MRGIVFAGGDVLKILSGRKTQTRRLLLPQPRLCSEDEMEAGNIIDRGSKGLFRLVNHKKNSGPYHCGWLFEKPLDPRYRVGETLYCKETWFDFQCECEIMTGHRQLGCVYCHGNKISTVVYKADGRHSGAWISSMSMPEWASRCHVRITGVKVERLEGISEEDAKAEGVDLPCTHPECGPRSRCSADGYRGAFAVLWNKINPKRPWGSGDWVWALTFEKV